MSREEVRALAVGSVGEAFTEVKVQTVLQEFGEIINVSVNTFPSEILKGAPLLQYALVYYSDGDAYQKALAQASRIREKGFYVGGITQREANFLNLKRSETGAPNIVSLHRLLEYIYISNKMLMFEVSVTFIDHFFTSVQSENEGAFSIDPFGKLPTGLTHAQSMLIMMPKAEFRAELLMSEFTPTGIQLFQTQQMLLLIKFINLSKMEKDHRIPEFAQKYMLGCFKPFKLEGLSERARVLMLSCWRIAFITEHLKLIELSSKTNPEWYIEVLSLVQDAYFELLKTFYPFRNLEISLFDTLEQLLASPNKKPDYPNSTDPIQIGFPLKELFDRPKDFFRTGFKDCTQAMLGLPYFKNHPRKLLKIFLKSSKLILALSSRNSVEYAATWLEKVADKNTLCSSFPQIQEDFVLVKSLIFSLKGDLKLGASTLLELLHTAQQTSKGESSYDRTVNLLKRFGNVIEEPIMLRSHQFITVENGLIAITEENRILLKVFGDSSINSAIESTAASLRYRDQNQQLRYSFSKGTVTEVQQGPFSWSYDLPCPDLGEESITLDKMEIKMHGLMLIIEPSTPVSANGLSEQIRYRLEVNRPQLLRQIKAHPQPLELVLAGNINNVVIFMKVHCNELESTLKIHFKDVLPGLVEDKIKIIYLTKGKEVEKSIADHIIFDRSNEKHYALLLRYHPGLNPSERRELGVLVANTTFHCVTGDKQTRLEQRLVLQMAASVKASIDSIGSVNRLQLSNGLQHPAEFILEGAKISLGPGECYSHLSIDKPLPSKLMYSFEDRNIEVIPALSAWNPKLFEGALAGWDSKQIELLVHNPQDSPLVSLKVEAQPQTTLNSPVQMSVLIEPSQNQQFVIGLNEFDMQDILVIGKGSYLIATEVGKPIKLVFNLWPMRSGLVALPEVTVCLFESPTRELGNDRIYRHPFWPFIKVVPASETVCAQTDNLFNQRLNIDGEVF